MALEIKPYNYMQLSSDLTRQSSGYGALTPEFMDGRLNEIRSLGADKDLQFIGALLEHELAFDTMFHLAKRDDLPKVLYVLEHYDPFHNPIAASLSQETINSFRDIKEGSPHFEKWDKNQAWYVHQNFTRDGKRSEFLNERKEGVTLRNGFESFDYYVNVYSYSICAFFYVYSIMPDRFPDEFGASIRHACGVEQVRNSRKYKEIRKTLVEKMENGDFPKPFDVAVKLEENLHHMLDWLKPRDVKFADAYLYGKRDINWIEQYAPAVDVLDRITEGLAERGFHKKWAGVLPVLILDLCEHVLPEAPEKASKAFYSLAQAMASNKVMEHKSAPEHLARMAIMAEIVQANDQARAGQLAILLIQHKEGKLTAESVSRFAEDHDMSKPLSKLLEGLYTDVIERAKVMDSLGVRSGSKAMLREKGRALSDDLGI